MLTEALKEYQHAQKDLARLASEENENENSCHRKTERVRK
jgi:hypothetical protein